MAIRAVEVDVDSPPARACLARYYEELSRLFDDGFDPALSIVTDTGAFTPPRGVFLLLEEGEHLVACGGWTLTAPAVAYLKRMWVDPDLRGRGLGRRLLAELEASAARAGCTVVRLETNRALSSAIALYRSSGYREVEPFNDEFYAHHWFEKSLAPSPR